MFGRANENSFWNVHKLFSTYFHKLLQIAYIKYKVKYNKNIFSFHKYKVKYNKTKNQTGIRTFTLIFRKGQIEDCTQFSEISNTDTKDN